MKILHSESSRGWGGQELRILAEAGGMIARGHAVWIAAPPDSPIARTALSRGLPLVPLPFRRPWGARALQGLRGAIRDHGIEVMNTHSSWDSWLGGLAARLAARAVKVVRTRHLSTPIGRSVLSRLLYTRLAHHVVTTGEAIRRQMIQENGFPADRLTSVVTGVNLAEFRPTRSASDVRREVGLQGDGAVVGTLSTLRSWKGHLDFLEALALLRPFRDLRGLIVGDGPYAEVIRSRIAALRLEDRVVMAGHREDVPDLLAVMDVFAFPSTAHEGVPQAVLQAMVLRRPVVASNLGGIPEVVRDGETGLLVSARDSGALAQGVARVLDDPGEAARRAEAALDLVRREYTLEAMLDKMEGVYHKVLGTVA